MKRTIISTLPVLLILLFVFFSSSKTDALIKPAGTCWQTICVTVDGKYVDCKVKIYDALTDEMIIETETGEDGCVDVEIETGKQCYATGWCGAPVIAPFTACTGSPIVLIQ